MNGFQYLGPLDQAPVDPTQTEPPVTNVTNMEQYRGDPNTVFIDQAARKIQETGPGGQVISSDPMPKTSAERQIPQRPTPEALDLFTQLKDFEKQWKPQAEADGAAKGTEAANQYIDGIWNTMAPSDKALLTPEQRAKITMNAKEIQSKTADAHVSQQGKVMNALFAEKYKSELDTQRALTTAAPKTPNEIELIQRANAGDPVAKQTLATMQKMKEDVVTASQTRKDAGIDVPGLAKAVGDGQDAPVAIKGSMGNPLAAKVKSEVLKEYPKFDFNMADANYKWKQSSTNQRTVNFAGGALPRLGALDDQLSKLPNGDVNMINKVMSAVSKEFGKPEYTNFEANRNAIVQEINTALSGTSQASDLRIKIELDNLKSSRSPAQISGSIANLRNALEARLNVDLNPLYPIEVVRGDVTLGQYKDEMFKKYRGNYNREGATGGQGTPQPNGGGGTGSNVPTVGSTVKGYRFKGGNPADKNSWEKM